MRKVMVVIAIVVAALPVAAQNWTPPRTPWGDPDLQGLWPSVELLSVPFERPAALGEKATLTDEEFAQLSPQSRAGGDDFFRPAGSTGARLREYGTPQRQTSLIVDPRDGRLPPLTTEGARRRAELLRRRAGHNGPEDFTLQERCLGRGALGSMLPEGSTNGNQIIQAPGLVAIVNEMVHAARLIPLDGRPHLGAGTRNSKGDSRGRWEGRTLVVETINFSYNSNHIAGGAYLSYSRDARLTERFTRIDADTIRYEGTVDDPTTWTHSWTVAKGDPNYQLFEYACHEGNLSLPHMLRGARVGEN